MTHEQNSRDQLNQKPWIMTGQKTQTGEKRRPDISIIIPVLHETALIYETLEIIEGLNDRRAAEVIVVDGDPGGSTIKGLHGYPLQTLTSPRGRSLQMNAGARLALGDMLLFLHADTRLPKNGLRLIRQVLRNPEAFAGAFDLGINSPRPIFRVIEQMANRRSRITRIPYGDQAIFIRKAVFERLSGYQPFPIMEDIDLMQRVKRAGGTIALINEKVRTSPRRWENEGVISCTLRNWLLSSAFYLKVPPEKLKNFYP